VDLNKAIQSAVGYYQTGNFYQAVYVCEEILKNQPDNFITLQLLSMLYYHLKEYESSMHYIKQALRINPNDADANYNLGNIFKEKKHLEESIACYQKALQADPNFAEAYCNLGSVHEKNRQIDKAIACYQKALQINPRFAEVNYNLGGIYGEKGELDDAIACYKKALQINPNFAAAYMNLGSIYGERQKGQLDEAIACYQKALQINPNFAEAYLSLGMTFKNYGKWREAITAYDNAIFLRPNYAMAYWARCMAHIPIMFQKESDIEDARNRYYEELLKLRELITPQEIERWAEAVGSDQPFYLAYQGFNDRELQSIYGDMVCRIMSLRYPQFAQRPRMPTCFSGEPLRVGIVSGYFHYHPNWKVPIKGWVENIDKHRFKLYGYYTGTIKDNITENAEKYFTRFVKDIYSFEEMCEIIHDDDLHIIIYPETGIDAMTVKLAALRLAPIQCTSWGHPNTSGLPTMDYFISGDLIESAEADNYYTEQLIRLPNLSIYYTPWEIPATEVNRDAFGLRRKAVLFHCCQSLFKFLPQYDIVFARIAQEVEDCQFIFASHPQSSFITEQIRSRIYQAFNRFNLNAEDYVVFLPFLGMNLYEALNCISDVFLDPIGWSGCNSVLEAINRNLPVVTYPDKFMRSREGSAILTMMGLTEIIPQSVDDYIKIAIRLGKDFEWRRFISEKIAQNKHLLYRDRTSIIALEIFIEQSVAKSLKSDNQ
jgi:protein O-GlcNAc transferase